MGVATANDISALAGSSGVLVEGSSVGCTILGFSLASFGGSSRIRVREKDATGKILLTLVFLDGQSGWSDGMSPLRCGDDLFVQFVGSGANLEGSIWTA